MGYINLENVAQLVMQGKKKHFLNLNNFFFKTIVKKTLFFKGFLLLFTIYRQESVF